MTEIDPKANPRYLGPQSEDRPNEEVLHRAAVLRGELEHVGNLLELTGHPLWGDFAGEVTQRMTSDVEGLTRGPVHDPQTDAYRRGAVSAATWVLSLPDQLHRRREAIREELRSLEGTEEQPEEGEGG